MHPRISKFVLRPLSKLFFPGNLKESSFKHISLSERLKLEMIIRTSHGSIFQIMIASIAISFAHFEGLWGQYCRDTMICVIVIQSLRWLLFVKNNSRYEDLIKHYRAFMMMTFLTQLSWGISCFAAIHFAGTSGIGVALIFLCVGIISALSYSCAPVPRVQVIFMSCLFIPMLVALSSDAVKYNSWLPSIFFMVHVLYSLFIGDKQNKALKLILGQQDRIQKDLASAKGIQQSLLPPVHQRLGPYQIDFLYLPCEELSGDFFQISENVTSITLAVFDVTSHGTASAQVTYLLKGIFEKIFVASESELNVASAVKLFAFEYAMLKLDYGVSLFVGKIDKKTSMIDFVTSNFPDPIFITDGKSSLVSRKSAGNPLIDPFNYSPDKNFTSSQLELSDKSDLFIFTDGCYEFINTKNRQFGLRALERLFGASLEKNWQENVLKNLVTYKGETDFDDDITILRIAINQ